MNRFNRQWLTLSDPLPASYEFYMTHPWSYYIGYRAYGKIHPVQLMSLYEALEYERYKNGRLRKKLHEQKQACKSLRNKLNIVSEALAMITNKECCAYGFDKACNIADNIFFHGRR